MGFQQWAAETGFAHSRFKALWSASKQALIGITVILLAVIAGLGAVYFISTSDEIDGYSYLGAIGGIACLVIIIAIRGWNMVGDVLPIFPAKYSSAPGAARLGNLKDLKKAGLVDYRRWFWPWGTTIDRRQQIYCGQFEKRSVYYGGNRMIVTTGPTRAGKGMRMLVPNIKMLTNRPLFIIDPKAELTKMTFNFRRKLGPAIIINPYNVLGLGSAGFNPLIDPTFTPKSLEFASRAAGLAEARVRKEGPGVAQHWTNRARALDTSVILYTKLTERATAPATMGDVMEILGSPYDSTQNGALTLKKVLEKAHAHPERELSNLAGQFLTDNATNEMRATISTLNGHIWPLNDKAIIADMAKHPMLLLNGKKVPFDFRMMKDHIFTVYVILPDTKLKTHSVWLRMLVSCALRALMDGVPGLYRPLLMLDEAGNLDHLEPLENAMSMGAGKGITVWPAFQSLEQIKQIYGASGMQTFLSAAGVLNSFAPSNDLETARYLSERCGTRTAVIRNYADQPGVEGQSKVYSPQSFPLMRPEDVSGMRDGVLLNLIDHVPPLLLDAPGYWEFCGKDLDENPYYRP